MSNYWDLGCRRCNVRLSIHMNHGGDRLLVLVTAAPALAQLGRALPDCRVGLRGFDLWGEGSDDTVPARWFAEHDGHEIAPIDEYGAWLDQAAHVLELEDLFESEVSRFLDGSRIVILCSCGAGIIRTKPPGPRADLHSRWLEEHAPHMRKAVR